MGRRMPSLFGLIAAGIIACGGGTDRDDAGPTPPAVDGGQDASESDLPDGATPQNDAGENLPNADAGTLPFPINDAGQVLCGTLPCACSNGIDDDEDGLSDLEDPECVSSWDNDEASLATGIAGDNRDDACQDCFFDGNSGAGNDGCYLPSSCITLGDNSSGRGRCNTCEQSDQCRNTCQAYTPNGCDCFGCCGIQLKNGDVVNVILEASCKIDGNQVEGCRSCVPNDSCINNCGKCELCPGKTLADLPADCAMSSGDPDAGTQPPAHQCDDGQTVCGAGLPACSAGFACEFGCCTKLPVIH